MAKFDSKVACSILKKVGYKKAKPTMSEKDLKKKIEEAFENGAEPEELTKAEVKLLDSLGYNVEAGESDDEDEEKPAKKGKASKKSKDEAEEEDEEDEDSDDDEEDEDSDDDEDEEDEDEDSDDDEEEDEEDEEDEEEKPAKKKAAKGGTGKAWFVAFWKKTKSTTRKALMKAFIKANGEKSKPTCENLIGVAKRDDSILGKFLAETTDDDGNKVLTLSKKMGKVRTKKAEAEDEDEEDDEDEAPKKKGKKAAKKSKKSDDDEDEADDEDSDEEE